MKAIKSMVSAISSGWGGTPASWTRPESRVSAALAEFAWMVVTPPGCPVSQAFRSASASAPAHLADDDAVGAQPHGRADQAREIDHFTGMQLNQILGPALDLQGVFDDHVALALIGTRDHLVDQRACERRLARASAPGNRDVPPAARSITENLRLRHGHDSVAHVVVECVEHLRRFAHGEARTPHDRGHQSLETDALDRKLTLDNRMVVIG